MINRWIILLAGVVIQTVFGGIYAWSTFVPCLEKSYDLSKGECGLVFGVTIAVFTIAMTQAGRLMSLKGARFTAAMGAILFTAGYLVASLSNGSFSLLLIGIGVVSGTGIGFGYVCPLSVAMKYFPNKKGLVTGVAVAGFGGGAILLASIAGSLLKTMDVLLLFRYLGLTAGAILLLASLFLVEPQTMDKANINEGNTPSVFNVQFGLLALGIFSGTFAGLLLIGNLTQIVSENGLTMTQSAATVSIFALGNVVGRVFWGYAFDKLNYKCIPISLLFFALLIPTLLLSPAQWAIMICVGLIGFGFGANFVVYAGAITLYFGTEHFSKLYPICFLAYGVAGVTGPGIGGRLADSSGSYNTAIYLSTAMVTATAILIFILLRKFTESSTREKQETVEMIDLDETDLSRA